MDRSHLLDLHDSRLRIFLYLKDRDVRRETGLFIAEGEHVVRRAFESGLSVRSVLVVDSKAERVQAMITAPGSISDHVEVLVCSKDVMAQTVGMRLHQGIIAAVEPPPTPELGQVLSGDLGGGTVVVCPEITNVENLGLLVRVCAGLGVGAMVLGPRCCDPWYRRAVRVSMGAVFTLPMVRSVDMDADLQRLRDEFGYELVATVIDEDAEVLRGSPPFSGGRGRGAILLGSEGYGLSPDIVQQCDRKVRIPMHDDIDSLNVAVAAGIVIHHFTRA